MVRSGILLVLAALLAVAYPEKETVFRPGKEYVFDYESQVLSEVPANKKVLSGVKIKSIVRMQMKSASRVHLQLEDIKIVKALDEFTEPYTADDILPIELFSEVTGEFSRVLEENLIKPIKFRYEDGRVSDIETNPAEPYFSLNVKKGLLSLLNINMQEIGAMDDTPADLMEIITKNSYEKEPKFHGVFAAMEEGVDGICESVYAIVESPDASMITPVKNMVALIMKDYSIEGPALKVVKVRNYDKCKKRPAYLRGILTNRMCPECSVSPISDRSRAETQYKTSPADILTSTAHTDYILTGNRHNFLIHKAVATGKHKINPLAYAKTQPETTVKQVLNLIKVQAPSVTIKPGSALATINNMMMEMPSHLTDGVAPFIGYNMPSEVDKRIEAVESILAEIANMAGEEIDPKAAAAIIELIHIAKKIPTPALAALAVKYAKGAPSQDPIKEKKKEILLDIIPSLAHPGSVIVIKKLIMEDIISEKRAALMIHQLAVTMIPPPKMILELLELAQEDMVKDKQLKTACLMAAGALTHKIYKTARNMVDPYKKITLAEKHKIANEFRKLLEIAVTNDAKGVVLTAIGNAGLPELVPQIREIIVDRNKPEEVRMFAIFGLTKLAPILRRKVQSILLPIFLDVTEPDEIRISAFTLLMDSKPSIGVAQVMVHSLKTETSLHVGSVVYSWLKSYSYSSYPSNYRLANVLKVALMNTKPFTPGIQYSKAFRWDVASSTLSSGIALEQYIGTGYKTLLPSSFYTKVNLMALGHNADILEFGAMSEGLSAVVADLVGPANKLKEYLRGKADLKDIIEPIVKKAKSSKIADIAKKVKIAERFVRKLDATGYIAILGNVLTIMDIDTEYIDEIVEKAKMKLPEITEILKAGYHLDTVKTFALEDNAVEIPSVVGLPISFKTGIVSMTKLDAYVKVEGLPSIHEWLLKWKVPREAKVHLKLKPSMITDVHAFLGVDCTVLKAGTGYKADIWSTIPAEMKIVYEAVKKTVAIEYDVPQKEKNILKISSSPVAYMKVLPLVPEATVTPIEMKKISALPGIARPVPIAMSMGEKSLGVGIGVAGNLLYLIRDPCPFTMMTGPQEIAVKIYPGSDVPDKMEIKFMYVPPGHKTPSVAKTMKSIEVASSSESKEESSYFSLIGWGWGSDESKSTSVESDWRPRSASASASASASSEEETEREIARERMYDSEGNRRRKKGNSWIWGSEDSQESLDQTSLERERKAPLCDWSPIVPDTELVTIGIDPTAKREIVMSVRTKGDEVKRYIAAKVAIIPVEWMAHQINAQFIASPAVIPYKQYQKIAIDTVIKVPKYLFYEVPVPFIPEAEPIVKVSVICGAEGFTKKMIESVAIAGKVVDDKLAGFTPIETAIKVKYSPDAPFALKKLGVKVLDFVKFLPYHLTSAIWKHKYAENTPHKVELKAIVIPEENLAKVVLETPWETNIYSGISIPESLLPKKGWEVPVLPNIARHYTDNKLFPGQCTVYAHKVITFDKVKAPLPDIEENPNCEMVVAKDCTSSGVFAITARKEKDHENKLAMKLMGPDDVEIEIIPTGSGWLYGGDSLIVKVNGEKYMMTSPVILREVEGKVDSPVTYLVKKDAGVVIIDAKILGLTIITNGDEIEIKASPWFHGKTCGICGDYDGEMSKEFRGPRNEMYSKSDRFAVSYMIPDDKCKLDDVRKHYKMDEVEIPASRGSCGVLMKHSIKEEMVKGVPKKCISVIPVETCGLGCMEENASSKNVPFHCLPAEDPATDRMIRRARREGLEDWTNKSIDSYGTVTVPTRCVPVY